MGTRLFSWSVESGSQRTPLRAFLQHGVLVSRQVRNAVPNVSNNAEFSHSLIQKQTLAEQAAAGAQGRTIRSVVGELRPCGAGSDPCPTRRA